MALFSGKTVVVTGATSGIGRATALAFAREGASLVAVGRNRRALKVLAGEAPLATCAVEVDVTTADAPDLIVRTALEAFGRMDVLVNAAGVIATAPVESTEDEQWDRLMDVNVRAPFRLMRAAFPHLHATRGNVVNVSSVNGLRAFPGMTAYCTSKAAMDHLTRCAALDWAPCGLRVNAVNPGVTVTNLHRRGGMAEEAYATFLDRAKQTHPLGRPGEAADIASLILYLASDAAGWITGETIAVDGGRHLTCAR